MPPSRELRSRPTPKLARKKTWVSVTLRRGGVTLALSNTPLTPLTHASAATRASTTGLLLPLTSVAPPSA
jgi:hypothetical protein